jgi:hypothetical protein
MATNEVQRRLREISDLHLDVTAYLMGATEHATEAKRLVNAGARGGIVNRLFSLAINKEIDASHRNAMAAWEGNIAVEKQLSEFSRELADYATTPQLAIA